MGDRDCIHGQLARSCSICELERDVAERDVEIQKLKDRLEDALKDALFWKQNFNTLSLGTDEDKKNNITRYVESLVHTNAQTLKRLDEHKLLIRNQELENEKLRNDRDQAEKLLSDERGRMLSEIERLNHRVAQLTENGEGRGEEILALRERVAELENKAKGDEQDYRLLQARLAKLAEESVEDKAALYLANERIKKLESDSFVEVAAHWRDKWKEAADRAAALQLALDERNVEIKKLKEAVAKERARKHAAVDAVGRAGRYAIADDDDTITEKKASDLINAGWNVVGYVLSNGPDCRIKNLNKLAFVVGGRCEWFDREDWFKQMRDRGDQERKIVGLELLRDRLTKDWEQAAKQLRETHIDAMSLKQERDELKKMNDTLDKGGVQAMYSKKCGELQHAWDEIKKLQDRLDESREERDNLMANRGSLTE